MERLTAFEFIPLGDSPQIVRLRRHGVVIASFHVSGFFGVALELWFDARPDLTIEGQGLSRPYWNDEAPAWTTRFDPDAEAQRIALLTTAMRRQLEEAR